MEAREECLFLQCFRFSSDDHEEREKNRNSRKKKVVLTKVLDGFVEHNTFLFRMPLYQGYLQFLMSKAMNHVYYLPVLEVASFSLLLLSNLVAVFLKMNVNNNCDKTVLLFFKNRERRRRRVLEQRIMFGLSLAASMGGLLFAELSFWGWCLCCMPS